MSNIPESADPRASTQLPKELPSSIQSLLSELSPQPLGPGETSAAKESEIAALDSAALFADSAKISNADLAECCLSGIWLGFNFLNKSHDLSQNLKSQSGSYWHAIMHRREPDYSNSAYWFKRVGDHPLFKDIAEAIADTVKEASPALQALAKNFDPYAFNDICEAAYTGNQDTAICEAIQLIEWKLLFNYCYQGAQA